MMTFEKRGPCELDRVAVVLQRNTLDGTNSMKKGIMEYWDTQEEVGMWQSQIAACWPW